ncbi:amylo-alpha-1,6-glucosidase [uncultured Blautia sp.]|uniref:amylo-alpha-1,6-glucosidase n=1 Tax=uncultured Blautia sp. TaxID=765821 RepID=UPI00280BE184|nr:amylo-alpha-1,6-glucosidase [uncultured Blautia sp.]
MKWIYGKQELKNLERGQENCYLLTNGLGGFSSMTMTGSVARNDHALLMACVQAPNHRYNMVHRLKESLCLGEEEIVLSSQEFADGYKEEGCPYFSSFVFDDMPIWRFLVQGVEIRKEIAMKQGENTVAVRYSIRNRSRKPAELKIVPFYQFTAKGSEPEPEQKFQYTKNAVISNGMTLYFQTNGTLDNIEEIQETYFYSYDACDGRRETGLAKSGHIITESVQPGEEKILKLVYSMENADQDADVIILEMQTYRKALEAKAGLHKEMAKELVKSASQFVSRRESTNGRTILAGYPFFEDWGRDTMIALPGICISTGQYETAKEILRTFAVNERGGLMPNLFPEGGNDPLYNTVDAALLFINCVYLYYQAAGDRAFVQEMYPVMERIIKAYREGTDYGIHMDEDGLIQSGEGLWQVTWMDVRVGDILPTPRHGKPVEINAYWYNALCIMDELAETADKKAVYTQLKEKVKASFVDKFWMDDKKCLKDLVSGTKADAQIRCNQIWAVSLTFTMLDPEKEQQVVETVFEKLYTPYGIRTLEQEDQEFHGLYQGKMEDRDMAYHQGTVWTFPLGAYYLAYLKVNQYSPEAKKIVREQLEVMEAAMREGCIGQLPEIYDGENPTRSKGCFAQAWSVGEILRVYEALEKL